MSLSCCPIVALLTLVFAILAFGSSPCRAGTWYVSNEGDDDRDGTSQASALRTIGAAAKQAQRGDHILLRRGDVFRESVHIETPDLTIDAYGPAGADLPAISGSVPITGWKPFREGIFVARTEREIGYLYLDRKLMTIARYPNTEWLRTRVWREESSERRRGGNTTILCPELKDHPRHAEGYWVGATVRWRHHSWWYETRPVVASSADGELTLGDRSFSRQGPDEWDTKGWGFYIDHKLEELDAPGEWYFDADAGNVYFYPPDGVDLNEALVEGTALSEGLSVRDATVRHLCFRHQKDVGMWIDGRCVVEHCLFEGIGRDALVSERAAGGGALRARPNTDNARVMHNVFRDNLNVGIAWGADNDATGSSVIERNVVDRTGVVAGYGGSGSWHGVGILISTGRNVRVQYNRVHLTGYAGILLGSDGNFAEYNVISRAMETMNDGGGIYTNCSRSTIRHNIILDVRGGMESSGSWPNIAHGIWPEFLKDYRESVIEGNTCARCGSDGLFLPNNFECVVRDNVLYDNRRYQMLLTSHDGRHRERTEQKHLISGNVLYAREQGQPVLYFDHRHDYGTLKGNYYCSPRTTELVREGRSWPGTSRSGALTLEQWQEKYSWADREARTDVEKLRGQQADRSELFINDTDDPKTIDLEGAWRDLDGLPAGPRIVLEPYTSVVLVRVGLE
jgi:parallel beta helix pectate lyase-like protein